MVQKLPRSLTITQFKSIFSYSFFLLAGSINATFIVLLSLSYLLLVSVSVPQQGNRSSSSACGSADVLEALGIVLDLDPEVGAFLTIAL